MEYTETITTTTVETTVETHDDKWSAGVAMKRLFEASAETVVQNTAQIMDDIYDECSLCTFDLLRATEEAEKNGEDGEFDYGQFMPTDHCWSVGMFMYLAGQEIPDAPSIPSDEVRRLRAKLTLEEAFEAIEALGFKVTYKDCDLGNQGENLTLVDLGAEAFDLEGVIKESLDQHVIATGTLLSCGVALTADLQREVDCNNLIKFRKDKDGHRRADGKWVKPSDHPKARVLQVVQQGREVLGQVGIGIELDGEVEY